MKLLFENWRQFLTEVTYKKAKSNLSDKTLDKAFNAAKWDLENHKLDPRVPTQWRNPPQRQRSAKMRSGILYWIPDDIEDNQKGSALLWLIRVILKKPSTVEEKSTRAWLTIRGSSIWVYAMPAVAARAALETFFQHNRFMSERDINKFKTLKELYDVVDQAKPDIQAYLENESYLNAEEGKLVIYEDDEWQIIIPINKGAACELGERTDWCTGKRDQPYYEEYHKPDDPLFIFVEKVESGNIEIQEGEAPELKLKAKPSSDKFAIALYNEGRELVKEFRTDFKKIITFDTESLASGTYHYVVKVSRYQFHFGSEQFMNQDDVSIEGNEELFYMLALLKKAENVPAHIKEEIKNADYQELDNGGIFISDLKGLKEWYLNHKLHRTDGPAVVRADGTKSWYLNGKLHRTDGPAVVWADGTKGWYLNGRPHRTDGPAAVYPNGTKHWYLNGKQFSEAEWEQKVQKMKGTELTEQRLIRIIKEELRNYETPI